MIGLALWLVCYCFPLMIVCYHRLLQVTTTDWSMNFLSRFFLAKPMRQQSTSYVSPQSSHLPCKIQLLCDQKLPGNGILMQKFLLNLASTIPSWNSATSSNILAESPPPTMSTMVANSCKDLQPTRKEHYFNATYNVQCCRKHHTNVEQNKLKMVGMKPWHSLKQ